MSQLMNVSTAEHFGNAWLHSWGHRRHLRLHFWTMHASTPGHGARITTHYRLTTPHRWATAMHRPEMRRRNLSNEPLSRCLTCCCGCLPLLLRGLTPVVAGTSCNYLLGCRSLGQTFGVLYHASLSSSLWQQNTSDLVPHLHTDTGAEYKVSIVFILHTT